MANSRARDTQLVRSYSKTNMALFEMKKRKQNLQYQNETQNKLPEQRNEKILTYHSKLLAKKTTLGFLPIIRRGKMIYPLMLQKITQMYVLLCASFLSLLFFTATTVLWLLFTTCLSHSPSLLADAAEKFLPFPAVPICQEYFMNETVRGKMLRVPI